MLKRVLINTSTIYEYPRTLAAIQKYLPDNYKYSDKKSKNFHKYFIDKFNTDWSKAKNNIPSDIFMIIDENIFLRLDEFDK